MNSAVKVGIIMGSESDLDVMEKAKFILDEFGIKNEITVVSAHRTPERMVEYGKSAVERGLKVIIAGAGGAAHLPGMVASLTSLPVVGVPIESSNSVLGLDSLLSIVQMPGGVPVATVGVDNAKNAGLLAVRILGTNDPELTKKLANYSEAQKDKVAKMIDNLDSKY